MQLKWDTPGSRTFQSGLDRAVLYLENREGVPWNGLRSVDETSVRGDIRSYYIDGINYNNLTSPEDFEAVLEAFTYPDEFLLCDGTAVVNEGLYITRQPKKKFNLSYRTRKGDDISGFERGYLIHLIYNVIASSASKKHTTIGRNVDPVNFQWKLRATPKRLPGFAPTAHFIVDSTRTDPTILEALEDILYGTTDTSASMIDVAYLLDLFQFPPDFLEILANRNTGLSPILVSDQHDLFGVTDRGFYALPEESRIITEDPNDGFYRLAGI